MDKKSPFGDRFPPLIYTKVHIPHVPALLSRPRLVDFLHENIHRKLLLVCAGPGYGKTSLLVDYARNTDLPVCWYSLDPSDSDPPIFLDYLVEAVRVCFPAFGRRTRAMLRHGGGPAGSLRETIGTLANELAEQIHEYVVIILDDYHTVEAQEEINYCLDTLVRYLPENVHLIVSGRSIPPLSLARLVAQGEAAAIGADHLRFTPEEADAVLQQSLELHLPAEEVQALVEKSEGWITGILLGARAGRQETMKILSQFHQPAEQVYAYLAEEVLRHLDPEQRRFLQVAAIPRQVDAAFCNALLGRQDSAHLLSSLVRRGLFLTPLAGGWYRFHALFRDFLLREAQADRDDFVRLHRRTAQLWQERGETAEAIEHLLQAQAYQEAAQEIHSLVYRLFQQSRMQTMLRWIEALPEAVRREWPYLVFFHGRACMATGQMEKARASFEQAESLLTQRGDGAGRIQVVADRAVLARMQGNYQQALQMASEALAEAGSASAAAMVDLHRTVAVCLQAMGEMSAALEHARAAVEHSVGTDAYGQALAHLDLGFCLRAQGGMAEAESAYRRALEHCRAAGSPELEANILNNLAMGPFLRGEFQTAQELLLQALEAARTALSPRLQALILAGLGDLYRDIGDASRSRQSYGEGLEHARQAHYADLVVYLLEAQGNLARQEGSLAEAGRYLQEALATKGLSRRDRARLQVSTALLEMAYGRTAEALAQIEAAVQEQERAGWRMDLLRSLLAQAIVRHHDHQIEGVRQSLQKAARLAAELDVLEPFLAERAALEPLLRQLPASAKTGPLAMASKRFQQQPVPVSTAAAGESKPFLRILALGTARVFREDREIVTREWGYRRSRELFFYLLV